jgi:hypothetical protein
MRLNGSGALTLEDARTWLEETGLCLFLPRRQYSAALAPSFVEAVAGHHTVTPDPKQVALAEELLVRLENSDIAVRLNLLGQPGEQPDFIVASWVLPYVYALRGDRDWRRTPQLTGSRQVSPLAIQTYKLLEAAELSIPQLKHQLGREVTEAAVTRAITELWQQLRIIPVIAAPGQTPKWQLLRNRYQKAIAEGASTSQVTAISVLASIYLQAVIAGSMEDVEMFLVPLTSRSKVREVVRGLVATRQVHTMSMSHAPHFYVAGTLPEFTPAQTLYASSAMPASSYFLHAYEHEEEMPEPKHHSAPSVAVETPQQPVAAVHAVQAPVRPAEPPARKPAPKAASERPHFSRPTVHARDRKPAQSSSNGRIVRHASAEARGPRWSSNAAKNSKHKSAHASAAPAHRAHSNGTSASRPAAASTARSLKAAPAPRAKHTLSKPVAKAGASHSSRPRTVAAGAKAGSGKRFGFNASRQGSKKRG